MVHTSECAEVVCALLPVARLQASLVVLGHNLFSAFMFFFLSLMFSCPLVLLYSA